jgi:POT family proton-dependent oligopeptide transporter
LLRVSFAVAVRSSAAMCAETYRTTPEPISTMPPGIPFIIGNECAERFSFYGMRTILVVFMTKFLVNAAGQPDVMSENEAMQWFHGFVMAVYFLPILGSLLADGFLGKYRTIIALSLVYCLGHLMLALDETRLGLFGGLGLIALGAGGIKPCVSAHLGDQFGALNRNLLEKAYGWFYFSINFGSFFSTLLTPAILNRQGWFADFIPAGARTAPIAFAVPGVLMLVATIIFWLGRHRYVHVPPGGKRFVAETFSPAGLQVVARLGLLFFIFIPMFWSLWDQSSSAWVFQAEKMDREISIGGRSFTIEAAQVQAINPLLIMVFIPLFNYVVYPAISRVFPLTALRKIGIGFAVTAVAFAGSYAIEAAIAAGQRPHIGWQAAAFVVLTAAETMVSITTLEYAYTQAPPTMKSLIMAMNLLSVAIGNGFTVAVNWAIGRFDHDKLLTGPNYYAFFVGVMLLNTVVFAIVSGRFRERAYLQGDAATPRPDPKGPAI